MKNKPEYIQQFKIIILFVFFFFNAILLPAENIEDLGFRSETVTMMDSDGAHDICILSWNVAIIFGSNKSEQAEEICEALPNIANPYDVILLQEVWDKEDELKDCLRDIGFWHFKSERRAGLLTASRRTILDWEFKEYDDENGFLGCGDDSFKDKGFLYTELEMEPGCSMHVINTHLDAGSCPDDIAAKRSQLRELSRYLDLLEGLHCPEAIIVGGDMNVSYDPNFPGDICRWVVTLGPLFTIEFENEEDIPFNLSFYPREEICENENDLYYYMLETLDVTPAYDIANVTPGPTNTALTKVLDYILFHNDGDDQIRDVTSRTLTNFDNPSDHQPVESCFTYECPSEKVKNCEFDLSFTQFFCDAGDNVEITVAGNPDNPNHQWSIFLKGDGASCQTNFSNTEMIYDSEIFRENRTTISLPYSQVGGRCIIIRYAVDGDCCKWMQGLAAVTVPEQVVCDYDPFFTYEFSEVDCQLEIRGTALTESPGHIWKVHVLDDLEDCNVDNLDNGSLLNTNIHESRSEGTSEIITLDMNYEDLIGRCLLIRHGTWSDCCRWDEHLESFVVPEPVCNYDPHFSQSICRVGNELEITGIALTQSPYHIWKVHLVDEGEDCDLDNLGNGSLTELYHSDNADGREIITLGTDYEALVGRCLVITHGTWSECCDWRASREVITVPAAPIVGAGFTTSFQSLPGGMDQNIYTYSADWNAVPVNYRWTIEYGYSDIGPWTTTNTWIQGTGPNLAEVVSSQQDNFFYRVCNNVRTSILGPCSKDTKCEIIFPDILRSDDETENRITKISKNNISLFPNPASNVLTVNNQSELDLVIQLYSVHGQMIINESVTTNVQGMIELTEIDSGFYLVQVRAAESGELIKTEKLIISK